jgi:hypothetical protein
VAVVLIGGVVVSLSRSGIVIVLVSLALGAILMPTLSKRVRALTALVAATLIVYWAAPTTQLTDRILSIADPLGAGNAVRIEQWSDVFTLWTQSPLIVGAHTGLFTNVTSNLSSQSVGVAESGLLQMLISFGILGVVGFYGVMIGTMRALPRVPSWFIAGAVGGIAQSVVYQSIEVFPFMVVYALAPFVATRYAGDPTESLKAVSSNAGDLRSRSGYLAV